MNHTDILNNKARCKSEYVEYVHFFEIQDQVKLTYETGNRRMVAKGRKTMGTVGKQQRGLPGQERSFIWTGAGITQTCRFVKSDRIYSYTLWASLSTSFTQIQTILP